MTKRFFEFEKVALILGFTVDILTISGILLSVNLPNSNSFFQIFLSPGLAFIIWLLATYIYFSYLHHFWEKNRWVFADKFGIFILNDLIVRFRAPFQTFPLFVLLVMLSWIIFSIDNSSTGSKGFGMGLFFIVLTFGAIFLFGSRDELDAKASNNEHRRKVESNWPFVRTRIKGLLSNQQWVDSDDLREMMEVLGFSAESIQYSFAKYAFEHPAETKFAVVYNRKSKERMTSENEKVLINVVSIDLQKFMYV